MRNGTEWIQVGGILAAVGVFGTACTTSGGPPPDASTPPPTTGLVLDFVVASFAFDTDDAGPSAGRNLDGVFSTGASSGCGMVDRVSDLDVEENLGGCSFQCPDPTSTSPCGTACQGGVDNVLPRLVAVLDDVSSVPVGQQFQDAHAAGRAVGLVRVSGVDNTFDDPAVDVALFAGYPDPTSCPTIYDGDGNFYVDNRSLRIPGDLSQPVWQAPGAIVNGRLRVRYGTATGLAAEAPSDFPVQQLGLRVTLDSTGMHGTLGNASGWIAGVDLRNRLAETYLHLRSVLNGTIPQLGDLPSLSTGACGGDWGDPVGGLGLGLRFTLARATIVGTTGGSIGGGCSVSSGGGGGARGETHERGATR